jgi:hypothetical protein
MIANIVVAEATKTHHEHSKAMHTDSSHSMHDHKMHRNSTSINKDHMKDLKTDTATFTATASASYIYESSTTAAYSEAPYMPADTAMASASYIYESSATAVYSETLYMAAASTITDSTSSEMVFDVFTMSSCTDCIIDATMTEAFGTALITASVSAEDFTQSLSTNYVANTAMATPPYSMPPSWTTYVPYMTASAPSAGFATTSLAVFTGSAGRRNVDSLLVALLPTLAGMVMWV